MATVTSDALGCVDGNMVSVQSKGLCWTNVHTFSAFPALLFNELRSLSSFCHLLVEETGEEGKEKGIHDSSLLHFNSPEIWDCHLLCR